MVSDRCTSMQNEYAKCIEDSGLPIRVVEKAGVSLKRKFQRSDPTAERRCSREDCFICTSEGEGNCKAEGINYEIVCKECNYTIYHGDSAGNGFTRGGEHLKQLRLRYADSRMKKHADQAHDGRVPAYKMNITGLFGEDSMARQIGEAVRIRRAPPGQLVNCKDEWNYLNLPRITMDE